MKVFLFFLFFLCINALVVFLASFVIWGSYLNVLSNAGEWSSEARAGLVIIEIIIAWISMVFALVNENSR